MEVYCHSCARQVPGRTTSSGDLACTVCQSDFCEAIERAATAPAAAAAAGRSVASGTTSEVFVSSFTIDAPRTLSAREQQQAPRAQVVVIQETTPFSFDLLQQLMGGTNNGGIQMGDYASNEQIEQIMARLLQSYAPPRQPTSRSFIDKLPRLPVSPASSSEGVAASRGSKAPSHESRDTAEQPTDVTPSSEAGDAQAKPRYAFCCAGDTCTICHEAYQASEQVVELPCQHCFHEGCILPWLGEHNDCPVCRRKFEVETRPQEPGTPTPSAALPEGGEAQTRRQHPATQRLYGFLDRNNRPPRPGTAQNPQQQPGSGDANSPSEAELQRRAQTQLRVLQHQHTALRNQHAALRSQHELMQANMQELQRSSQLQLNQLLQQQQQQQQQAGGTEGAAAASLDGRVATPLGDLAARLRSAQRAVDTAQRQMQAFEALMLRIGNLPNLAAPTISTSAAAQATGTAAAAATQASPDAATSGGGDAPSGPLEQERRGLVTRQREARQQRQQRRSLSRSPSSPGQAAAAEASSPQQQQPQAGATPLAEAVDIVMSFPVFSVSLSRGPGPAVPIDRFMEPLSADEDVAMVSASPAPAPGPVVSQARLPEELAPPAAPVVLEQAEPRVGPAVAAVGSERVRSPQSGQLRSAHALVAGGLTLPWRVAAAVLGGMFGWLFGRRHAATA